MSEVRKTKLLPEAIMFSLGLMIFAFFVQYRFPVKIISFAGLLLASLIMGLNIGSLHDLKKIFGNNRSLMVTLVSLFAGSVTGILLAIWYRRHLGIGIFPQTFHLFAVTAVMIGCTEEIVFRGFLQNHLSTINITLSVVFSTLSHTGYKIFLFLSPFAEADIDIGFLAFYTFIIGLLYGIMRNLTGSLILPLLSHALFDLLVYGEYAVAPWWVW